jgi:hypothetical protein
LEKNFEEISFTRMRARLSKLSSSKKIIEKQLENQMKDKISGIARLEKKLNKDLKFSGEFEEKPLEKLRELDLLERFDEVTINYFPTDLKLFPFKLCRKCVWSIKTKCNFLYPKFPATKKKIIPKNLDLPILFPELKCHITISRKCFFTLPQKCVTICIVTVDGATTNIDRDVDTANEVYAQCGIKIKIQKQVTVDAPDLLDLDEPNCFQGMAITDEVDVLFDNLRDDEDCDIIAYYVRSISGGFRGCAAYPTGRPGFTVADSATKFTFAHELGHVLGLSHITDTKNLMNGPGGTGAITQDPPELTDDQCGDVKSSEFINTCCCEDK